MRHCDPAVRASLDAAANSTAAADRAAVCTEAAAVAREAASESSGNDREASKAQAVAASSAAKAVRAEKRAALCRKKALATGEAYVHPNKLDYSAIIAMLQMRRFGARHVVLSDFRTDDGAIDQRATVTVYLTQSHMFDGTKQLMGMKVLRKAGDPLPHGFVMLMYGGGPGGTPDKHNTVRDSAIWHMHVGIWHG